MTSGRPPIRSHPSDNYRLRSRHVDCTRLVDWCPSLRNSCSGKRQASLCRKGRFKLSSVFGKKARKGIGRFFSSSFFQFFVVVVSHYVFFVNAIGNSDADVACKPTNPLKSKLCRPFTRPLFCPSHIHVVFPSHISFPYLSSLHVSPH